MGYQFRGRPHCTYKWNPTKESKEYCLWDGPASKNCNNQEYQKGLIHLAHAARLEVYLSLGVWTLSDAFPAMAADATARATLHYATLAGDNG